MNKMNIFLTLSVFSFSVMASDFVTGTLAFKNGEFYINNSDGELKIETTSLILKSLPSLYNPSFVKQASGKPYAYEFKGEKREGAFRLSEVPTNIPGSESLRGILKYDKKTDTYLIEGHESKFGYTKILNGYQFDEISKKSFVEKDLIVEGDFDEKGIFVMQALTPANLFTAEPAKLLLPNPEKFILEEMPGNNRSRKGDPLRATAYRAQGESVEVGDGALIITLSGRQGDSFGSVNGHFVAGIAEVKEDMSLRGEVSNAYVTNTKDILSGNNGLTNYFSHLVQGQNIYRPTYTLIVYGIDKKKLKQFRDALEESHIQFRTNKLEITPQFNCTTETIKALRDAGIEGDYFQFDNSTKGVVSSPLKLIKGQGEAIQFALANDASRFHPAAAYKSFVKAFLNEKYLKKLGVKRVDYVFYPQIASERPVGGMALESVWGAPKYKKLYEQYEVNEKTKLNLKDLRIKLEEILPQMTHD